MLLTYQKLGIPVPKFQLVSLAFSFVTSTGFVFGVVASGKSPSTLGIEIWKDICRWLPGRTRAAPNDDNPV
jgi:hypothetical protein